MIAPALVDGRPLSHPDHDPIWRAFVEHGVTPGVPRRRPAPAVRRRVVHATRRTSCLPPLDSVFLWTAAALACTDLILNGTLERHPRPAHRHRRAQRGLGADVPDDARRRLRLHRQAQRSSARASSSLRPSEYFRRQVRVSSFSYELPARLIRQTGDLYMCCSDYPHSEGTATPLADYTGSAVPVGPDGRARAVPRQRVAVARERVNAAARRQRALEPQQGLDALRDAAIPRSVRTKSSS